jgi:hypothetical protein
VSTTQGTNNCCLIEEMPFVGHGAPSHNPKAPWCERHSTIVAKRATYESTTPVLRPSGAQLEQHAPVIIHMLLWNLLTLTDTQNLLLMLLMRLLLLVVAHLPKHQP